MIQTTKGIDTMAVIAYTDLKLYADKANITYTELSVTLGMNYHTLYNVIRGQFAPGKKTRRKLDAFINAHAEEIQLTLSGR